MRRYRSASTEFEPQETPVQPPSPAIPSNVLMFSDWSFRAKPSVCGAPALPARRLGRPGPSSSYLLGVRLFNRAMSIKVRVTAALDSIESRYVTWRLRRASKSILSALDELIILNTRFYPTHLDALVREVAARKRHWQVATPDIQNSDGHPDTRPGIALVN
jgi:hypothetical protein